jgi:putative membrane protein
MTEDDAADARTRLAVERTMLAWWRTGLASLAVALAVGRLLPEISGEETTWPYVTLGLAFASYACGLFVYGTARGALSSARPTVGIIVVAGGGAALAVATIVLIAAA